MAMQFLLASFFAIIAALGVRAQLTINTPINVQQCLPQLITWSGGTGPYFVSVQPGGQPNADALVNFGQVSGTSLTWDVNMEAGTSIGLTIRDQTGTIANSAPFTIGSSSDSACLTASLSFSAGPSTAGDTTTTAPTASTTGPSGTTSGTTSGTSTASTRTSASTSGSGTSTSGAATSNAAVPFADIGSAGVIGALVAAIFA